MDTFRYEALVHVYKSAGPARQFEPGHPIEIGLKSGWKAEIDERRAIEHHARATYRVAERQQSHLLAGLGDALVLAKG